jgi:hypothetical protein
LVLAAGCGQSRISFQKNERERNSAELPDAAPATELRKNIHPASPVCMAGTGRVLFLQGLKPRNLSNFVRRPEGLLDPVAIAAIDREPCLQDLPCFSVFSPLIIGLLWEQQKPGFETLNGDD